MEEECDYEQLVLRAREKTNLGHELVETLKDYKEIPGVEKIQRKILQEIKFLVKVIKNNNLKQNHVHCSNLTHYEFLVKILQQQQNIVHVDCGFAIEERANALRVDIVCDNGLKWIKAIARNSKSLTDAAIGAASYGARSILDQAEEFVAAAAQHLCMYKAPRVVFYFRQHIDKQLLDDLQQTGVETASLENAEIANEQQQYDNVSILNLDITTLLAYISALCNGSCSWNFQERILTEQAEKERESPLKPLLDKLFEGKRLICCEIAQKSFLEIVHVLAGPKERQRAEQLMQRVEVLPDVTVIPEQLAQIRLSGKVNERSLKIFAFGMHMQALTVTSNKAFIRSAKMQGINVPVFTHQARALTEIKEATATNLVV